MNFTFDLPTRKDKRIVLNMLERQLFCEHPRTSCPDCELEPACMFFAYLHREILRAMPKREIYNDNTRGKH